MEFELPPVVAELVTARNRLRQHYAAANLRFTLDGNLVGDIGEAVAAELFGLELTKRCGEGVDGLAPDKRTTVQVKASGSRLGPAFRKVETRADHLLFLNFDFAACRGVVTYNGPEHIALATFPQTWVGQRSLTLAQIRRADAEVAAGARLQPVPRADRQGPWVPG
jgi:hypothetical protein